MTPFNETEDPKQWNHCVSGVGCQGEAGYGREVGVTVLGYAGEFHTEESGGRGSIEWRPADAPL